MAIRYVRASGGSNANNGQSFATGWATLAFATANISAGDTLYGDGTFNEGFGPSIPSGSVGAYTTIAQRPGGTAFWITPTSDANTPSSIGCCIWISANKSYIEFDGVNTDSRSLSRMPIWFSTNDGFNPHHFRVKNATHIAGAIGSSGAILLGNHVTVGATGGHEILDNIIHGGGLTGFCGFACSSYGVYCAGPSNVVDGNEIYDVSGYGIQIYNASNDAAINNIIKNNRIHDITRTGDLDQCGGILIAGDTNTIYNNLIYDIPVGNTNVDNAGIYVFYGSGNKIWNNTIYDVANTGIKLQVSQFGNGGATNTDTRNNIVYLQGGTAYSNSGGGTNTESSNMFLGVDPQFNDAPNGDFSLKVISFPIDLGATIAEVTEDFAGISRPQGAGYDIGAYEFSATTIPSKWSLIGSITGLGDAGWKFAQSANLDTTGADALFLNVSRDVSSSVSLTVLDSLANTWIPLTRQTSFGNFSNQWYYCLNPTVGVSHNFRVENVSANIFPSFVVHAWAGNGTISFGGETGAVGATSTLQPGSLTPSVNDALLLSGVSYFTNTGTVTVDQSYTSTFIEANPNYGGTSAAYLVQPIAAARNPTWNLVGTDGYGFAATAAWFSVEQTTLPIYAAHYRMRRN